MMSSMAPSLPSLTSGIICLRFSSVIRSTWGKRGITGIWTHQQTRDTWYFTSCSLVFLSLSHITLLVTAVFTGESDMCKSVLKSVSEMFLLRCLFSCSASYRERETHPSVNMLEERLENKTCTKQHTKLHTVYTLDQEKRIGVKIVC